MTRSSPILGWLPVCLSCRTDYGATRAEMLSAFRRACQYEWLFWDGAYQLRGWPPIA